MDFLGMGFGEIILILIISLIVLGPDKIVGVARELGKLVYNFRKVTSDLTNQITREIREQERTVVEAAGKATVDIKEQKASYIGDAEQLVNEIDDLKTELKRDKFTSDK